MGKVKDVSTKSYDDTIKSLVEQANEYINAYGLVNQAEGRGMMRVINVLELVRANENVRTQCTNGMVDSNGKAIMIGSVLETVGELRYLMEDLDDKDQVCVEACDEHGDVEDLFPMTLDVIDGIELTDGSNVREVRFCQRPNSEPDTRDKQRVVDAVIDQVMYDHHKGDDTVIDELLLRMPFDVLKYSLPEDQWADFEEPKENVRDGATLIPVQIPSMCPFRIADFKAKYMQTHEEVCLALDYDEDDDGTNEMILGDGYFWLENEERWIEKTSSMYDKEEQEVADWLRG